tara:strand:+ start:345 stop:1571 length:1227 start_codon:yes stop_codon:yes gene_type:complete
MKKLSRRFLLDNSYLVFNQLLKLFFPIVIIPISLKLVGIQEFGNIASYLSIALIFCFITDFGVNIFGPPRLSSSDSNKAVVIFSELTKFKAICLILTQIFFLIYYFFFEKNNISLFIIFQFYAVGTFLDSLWYFFGTKNFKKIFLASLLGIVISIALISIFYFLDLINSLQIVTLLFCLPFFITSFLSFFLVLGILKRKAFAHKKKFNNSLFSENMRLFISQFISTIYLNIGPIITLNFIGPEASAIWFAINRLSMSLGTFAQVPYKVVFPDIASNYLKNKSKSVLLLKESFAYFFGIVFFGITVFFMFFDAFNDYFFDNVLTNDLGLIFFFSFWSFVQIVGPVVTGYLLVTERSKLIIFINFQVILILLVSFSHFISRYDIYGWYIAICLSQLPNIYFLKYVFDKKT